jgi:hypothetical protein
MQRHVELMLFVGTVHRLFDPDRDSDMLAPDLRRDPKGRWEIRGELLQEQGGRGSHSIALLELLPNNDPLLVQVEHSRIGDAVLVGPGLPPIESRLLGEMLVVQAEGTNDATPLVREERVADPTLLREPGQNRDRVVADGEEGDAGLFEVR